MPQDTDDHSIAHKFPYAACEVLSNCTKVIEALVDGGNDKTDANNEEKKETVVESLDLDDVPKMGEPETEDMDDDDMPNLEEVEVKQDFSLLDSLID